MILIKRGFDLTMGMLIPFINFNKITFLRISSISQRILYDPTLILYWAIKWDMRRGLPVLALLISHDFVIII